MQLTRCVKQGERALRSEDCAPWQNDVCFLHRPVRLLLGHDGEFGQLRRGDADLFEALGDDALRRREHADEQIHRCDCGAIVIRRSLPGFAQQADHIVGEEFAVEDEEGVGFAFLLKKEFAELIEQSRQVGAEAFAPILDARIGRGQQPHEEMRTAHAVPLGVARVPHRFIEGLDGTILQRVDAQAAAREKNIFGAFFGNCHGAGPKRGCESSFLIMTHAEPQRKRLAQQRLIAIQRKVN